MKESKGQLAHSAINYSIEHNYRLSFTDNEVFHDEQNEHLRDYKSALSIRKEWTDKALRNYKERTRQNSQIKDDEMHYSYVIACTKDTTPQEVYESVGKFIENELGSKIYDISIHKDEGQIIDHSKTPPFVMNSSVDFFYDTKSGAYYKDKPYKNMIAKDFNELSQKFEIRKNYHAHIEFSAMRKDGTSLKQFNSNDGSKNRKRKKQGLSNLGRDEMTNLKIDKYFLSTMNSRFIKLLNSELDKKGKELAKDNFNALDERIASQRPRQKRIKGFKHLQSYEQRLAQGEKLSEREMRAYNTLLEKSNKHAIKLYDEAQALKIELKATKSACKKFIKDEKMPYFNDKFDFLEQSPIFENGENAELLNALQNERLAFFKDLRDFADEFDIKQKGVNEFLNALNSFDERLEKAQRDFIENLEQSTIKISLFDEKIALNANEIQGYANRKLNELERAYYVVVDENKGKVERNEKLDFFELETSQMLTQAPTLYERVRTFLCEKFKDSINAVSDFIAHYKAKLRNNGHRM